MKLKNLIQKCLLFLDTFIRYKMSSKIFENIIYKIEIQDKIVSLYMNTIIINCNISDIILNDIVP